jgi:hypothetical protein
MNRALLGLAVSAAVATLAASASAQDVRGVQHRLTRGFGSAEPFCSGAVRSHDGDRHDGDFRNAGPCGGGVFADWYGGEWAYYNNRSWESDSYNDWWHDRPDRAYPAWMRNNQNCDRRWFAGDTLRC